MCGICGYVGDHRPELLEPMACAMQHRGPDDMGTWHDAGGPVGLGQRRLSIIDLSPAGHQPMCNEDGTVWITFNGEIYDFDTHRQWLLGRGHTFKSHSDTEVLLHLYEEHGPGFLQQINGMFALAIWDAERRQLLLARDHAGIKPLYYWQDGGRLFFASEIKALLRVPGVRRELNRERIADFLTFLWIPGDQTLLRGIQKLEPGHLAIWKDGQLAVRRWFSLRYEPDERVRAEEWIERVHDTFMRTTRRQMVADVKLGAFLSGGLDSSSIVACMRHAFPEREINCYTAHFRPEDLNRDQFVDDYPYARRVADHLKVNLKSFALESKMISLLPKMIYHLDEPDADPAIFPSYLISKLARDDGTTVLLSGTGGDEVFFGYRSHQAYRQYERFDWLRWLAAPALSAATSLSTSLIGAQNALPRRLRKFRNALVHRGLRRHLAIVDWSSHAARRRLYSPTLAGVSPGEEYEPASMRAYFDAFEGRGELNRHSHMLIQSFLAAHNFLYTDKSSMAASIEVRVPYLDLELMRLCAAIPERYKLHGDETKWVLKKAMERYLPRDVLYRAKTGFGAPLRKWIAEDLGPLLAELLGPKRVRERGLFDADAVQAVLKENEANTADHAYLIYCLLTLELWQQTFIDRAGEEVAL
ncbi:MAG: asparagine synthase (glutamine-hydrolyzing) [Planctomycetes bacterium]|nr:asparagine synthase (glutamine-hydrolyzing) [Planctomycetota bacterium]